MGVKDQHKYASISLFPSSKRLVFMRWCNYLANCTEIALTRSTFFQPKIRQMSFGGSSGGNKRMEGRGEEKEGSDGIKGSKRRELGAARCSQKSVSLPGSSCLPCFIVVKP